VSFVVTVPKAQSEWRLDGQTMPVAMKLTVTVGELKEKLKEMLGMYCVV